MHCKSSRKGCSGKTNIFTIFFEDTGYLNIYTTLVLSRSSEEEEVLLGIIMLEVLNLLLYKSKCLGRVGRENIFQICFLIYVHLSYNYYGIVFCCKYLLFIV